MKKHPNKTLFHGVLTLVDVPSDRAPAGSHGRRVILTRSAAESALPSLIGMALGWTPRSDGHDARRKVGVITHAELAGNELRIRGHIYAQDFPDAIRELRLHGAARMGLSYEITDAHVEDPRARIWRIQDATFTGAAILLRTKAAYKDTWIALGEATATSLTKTGETNMTKQQSQELIAATKNLAIAASSLDAGLTAALALNSDRITRLEAAAEEQSSRLNTVIDRIIAMVEEDDSQPQEELTTEAQRHGESKKEELAPCSPSLSGEKLAASITDEGALRQRITDLETENTSLRNQLTTEARRNGENQNKDVPSCSPSLSGEKLAASSAPRKTLPSLVTNLLAKSNIDINLSGNEGMDPHVLDSALAQLSIDQRIAVKMQMARAGLIA